MSLTRIKILAIKCGAAAISVGKNEFSITLGVSFIPKSMDTLFDFLDKNEGSFQGESTIKFKAENIQRIEEIINKIGEMC